MTKINNENLGIGWEKYSKIKFISLSTKIKKEKSNNVANNYRFSLSKLNNPIDKISNSFC